MRHLFFLCFVWAGLSYASEKTTLRRVDNRSIDKMATENKSPEKITRESNVDDQKTSDNKLYKKTVEKIIATVNNDIILLSDLEAFLVAIKNNGLIDDALIELYDRKQISSSRQAAIDYLVNQKLIDTEVERLGIQAPIERVEGEIRKILTTQGLTRDQLRQALQTRDVQFSDYQDFVKTSIQRQTLIEKEVSSKIRISDEDIAAYYIQNNSSSRALVFELTLSHIVFLISRGGEEKARARGEAVLERLKQGANFETLASQFSEDPDFTQGGLFGTFRAGDLVSSVENVVFKLSPGQTSELVKMPDGYHIFKVNRRTLVPSPDFERRRSEINSILFQQAFRRQFFTWMDNLKRSSIVRINK